MPVETVELAPGYRICRLLRGGWQLSTGHGALDRERAMGDMAAFLDAGVTAFDCADIYTGVEEMIGAFRERLLRGRGEAAARALKVHTKFVPDWDALATLSRADVRDAVERSLRRLRSERLDLMQFHWWNYDAPGMIEAAGHLLDLQREGKIHLLGGTNFDTARSRALIEAGIPLASMQVQYSLLDARPEAGLGPLCADTGMKLLSYGTLAGGFLSERWLSAPQPREPFANRSLVKYKLVIDEWGGWDLFQALLRAVKGIADRHGVGIAAVATRWVLDKPQVAGVIVGARYAEHLAQNLAAFDLTLDEADRRAISVVLAEGRGPSGDVFALERDREGPHGRIMKANLNRE
jgi:aryl-alcohol dehydrogenase-like predicted oxidoreductase